MRLFLFASTLCLTAVPPAGAESLISTLSDDSVEITSNFTGEQIVVFGAVRGTPSDDTAYQVAVVVQGPSQDVVVRQKERFLGIWANRASREFAERAVLLRHAPQREFQRRADARRPRPISARRAKPAIRAGRQR